TPRKNIVKKFGSRVPSPSMEFTHRLKAAKEFKDGTINQIKELGKNSKNADNVDRNVVMII
ncbi:hypothetical protein LOAG_13445, partial [Loa loa]